ncbi:hypothetical protein M2282_001221 [Variovorax boronicumulans]|uniref:restriction endonuclease n=1 Tax=Variovorax boronicumulans TaxID=436515 RepID=UPI0024765BC0|nr:restriction endonuclease [Variovorax boronicumulans]MDH6166080.1 hypothetical protein [Variovorax boronicumulans]
MSDPLLTPMLVQYLVGLCCVKWDADVVEATLGDMVYDSAAEKPRDVDVTVTVSPPEGGAYAFKAYEVKREKKPLDLIDVEQLCLKLKDMDAVTHRAIVSASGFSAAARKKAAAHGVELYELREWTRDLQDQFPALEMQGTARDRYRAGMTLLCWIQPQISIRMEATCMIQRGDALYSDAGQPHAKYPTFGEFADGLLLRSTELLLGMEPAATMYRGAFSSILGQPLNSLEVLASPAWQQAHTLEIKDEGIYVRVGEDLCRMDAATVTGLLQWQKKADSAKYLIIENVASGEAFAGALVLNTEQEGGFTALVFSPKTRAIDVRLVKLSEKHRNFIHNLKLELLGSDSSD